MWLVWVRCVWFTIFSNLLVLGCFYLSIIWWNSFIKWGFQRSGISHSAATKAFIIHSLASLVTMSVANSFRNPFPLSSGGFSFNSKVTRVSSVLANVSSSSFQEVQPFPEVAGKASSPRPTTPKRTSTKKKRSVSKPLLSPTTRFEKAPIGSRCYEG